MARNIAGWWIVSGFLIAIGTGIAVAMGVVSLERLVPTIASKQSKASDQDVRTATNEPAIPAPGTVPPTTTILREKQIIPGNRTKLPAATSVQTVRVPTSDFPPRVFEPKLSKPEAIDLADAPPARPDKESPTGELKTGTAVETGRSSKETGAEDQSPSNVDIRLKVEGKLAAVRNQKVTNNADPTKTLEIPSGNFSIQIEVVEQSTGKLLARTKIPIARVPNQPLSLQADGVNRIMIREGDTLWRIAKRKYGSGEQYLRIFEANRAQLPSPDLIEVGQILQIPQ